MASTKDAVLAYFRKTHPNATANTKFEDMGMGPRQILDKGTELAILLGCNPTRSQILACKTIGALITLLSATRINKNGVNVLVSNHFAANQSVHGVVKLR